MLVKLKVLGGSSKDKELPITGPEFLIGRGETCHLRPQSDAVSREHCVVIVNDVHVSLRDLNSKNGTFLNGDRLEGERELKMGDRIKISRLEFEVLLDHSLGGRKRPKVKDVKEAASRAAAAAGSAIDTDVSDWLQDADEVDRVERMVDPETRHFKFSERDTTEMQKLDETDDGQPADKSTEPESKKKKKREKKKPGKLPTAPQQDTDSSHEAAEQMLKKFFRRS